MPRAIIPVICFPLLAKIALVALMLLFVVIGATYYWVETLESRPAWAGVVMSVLWLFSGIGSGLLMFWGWRHFYRFGHDLSGWVNSLYEGKLTERMPLGHSSNPSYELRRHLNFITEDYQRLSNSMEKRIAEQTENIEQKKYYLRVLHQVALAINNSNSMDGLLCRFLETLQGFSGVRSVSIQIFQDNIFKEVTNDQSQADEVTVDIEIPVEYRDKALGVFHISVPKNLHPKIEEQHELLLSIGQHLGMAVEKANLDNEAKLLSIMQERTRMAHELHDSLAQTLASMRYRVRLLDESFNTSDDEQISSELDDLEGIIENANTELRSLITNFRAPIDGKGLVRSIEKLSKRFEVETGLEVFFYQNWIAENISHTVEIEVTRIVQEALANVRKHSQAKTVRILMYSAEGGECRILVEDDGVGFDSNAKLLPQDVDSVDKKGEHIGLAIMHERAERIGGDIQYESDPGEGTLVQLNFSS
ncbi:MAG: histidine kinase [Thiotrichaceae bacterium]|nr:histidine kinase [Thiotrichaceae bacterium]